MKTKYKWNKENMFFLTRDGDIEILHSDDEWEWELFHFGNQYLIKTCFEEGLDEFGRNYTDKLFIRLDVEIVSPILRGEAGIAQLIEVIRILNEKGHAVNSSCGVHVHVGFKGRE